MIQSLSSSDLRAEERLRRASTLDRSRGYSGPLEKKATKFSVLAGLVIWGLSLVLGVGVILGIEILFNI